MNIKPKTKMQRAIWLAFQASSAVGIGFLHSKQAAAIKESDIADFIEENADGSCRAYTDYLFGRMMKTRFTCDANGVLTVSPEQPRSDYQSWSGTYAGGSEIVAAAEASLMASAAA